MAANWEGIGVGGTSVGVGVGGASVGVGVRSTSVGVGMGAISVGVGVMVGGIPLDSKESVVHSTDPAT